LAGGRGGRKQQFLAQDPVQGGGGVSTGFSRPKIAKKNSVADPDPDPKHLLRVPIDCSSEFK
jgi:hypothetical protein